MGVYKRRNTWGISYFHNGKRIRKTIGRKALALLPGWTVEDTWHKSGTSVVGEEKGATG